MDVAAECLIIGQGFGRIRATTNSDSDIIKGYTPQLLPTAACNLRSITGGRSL